MKTFSIPPDQIQRRQKGLQTLLQDYGVDGVLIIQRVDQMYFSGTAQNGCLYIPAHGDPLLFIKQSLARAEKESPLKNTIPIGSIKEVPKLMADYNTGLPGTLGFELDVMPVNQFRFLESLFPDCKPVDASGLILKHRMIKSYWDIRQMEATADMSSKTFTYMRENLEAGLTEMEFAAMYESFARKLGHAGKIRVRDYQAEAYPWHVLSGENGSITGVLDSPASGRGTSLAFPCGAGYKKILPKEPVMVDFASVRNGFHMDETRMFAIGAMPDHAMQICKKAIRIHDFILDKAVPGIPAGDLFRLSVEYAKSLGCGDSYLGQSGSKVRFVGHGVGHELVEPPFLAKGKTDILQPGMTIAIEPKMVVKNQFAAGIESVFLVTATGTRLISRVPVQVFVV